MNEVFFYASKILFWGLQPSVTVSLLVLSIFVALLLRWTRLATWVAGALSGFLFIAAYVPLANPILRPLEEAFPVKPSLDNVEGIIVLGGGERGASFDQRGEVAVNERGERMILGAMLATRFPDATLVFTGGSIRKGVNYDTPESEIARQMFLGLGIEETRLVLEGRSRNTAENASLTRPMLPETLTGNWVLVTSASHMPRSVGVFCAAGYQNIIPYPVDHQTYDFEGFLFWQLPHQLETLRIATKEWLGLVAYNLTGRTDTFWPEGC